jgi:NAD(P)-dependent dehydrogenase (short-subunit alcohol dehydrogenase family)
MSPNTLDGRVVAITGSTGGLGSAVAQALRERGAMLALLDLDAAATTSQAAKLGDADLARGWAADVRDYSALENAMAAAAEHFGRVDVVVANAGIDVLAPVMVTDPVAFERVVDINLTGVWRTFRAALPYVQAQRGYLMAISSMAAFVHSPMQASYTAAKAGVLAMANSIRLEVRHLGVEVGTVHPTFFRTAMGEELLTNSAGRILWGGGKRGVFKTVAQHQVVDGIVRGIERRAQLVTVPRSGVAVAMAAGLLRPVIERVGFRGDVIERALAAADQPTN